MAASREKETGIDRKEAFMNSWRGIVVLLAILVVLAGSIHLFYPGGIIQYIKDGTDLSPVMTETRPPSE